MSSVRGDVKVEGAMPELLTSLPCNDFFFFFWSLFLHTENMLYHIFVTFIGILNTKITDL